MINRKCDTLPCECHHMSPCLTQRFQASYFRTTIPRVLHRSAGHPPPPGRGSNGDTKNTTWDKSLWPGAGWRNPLPHLVPGCPTQSVRFLRRIGMTTGNGTYIIYYWSTRSSSQAFLFGWAYKCNMIIIILQYIVQSYESHIYIYILIYIYICVCV